MTWTLLATIPVAQDWQSTPVIAADLGYVRLNFATAGVPVWIAQIDPDSGDICDERRIVATPYARIFEFEAPPVFTRRALAVRVPNFAQSFNVQIEVSNVPFISSGGTPAPIQTAAIGSVTTIDAATQAVDLLEANPNRKKLIVINNSTATMYLAFGEVASPTNYTIAVSADGDGYELEGFTGVVSAVWTDAIGKARITEFE